MPVIATEKKAARPTGAPTGPIRVSEVISSLSFALDLTEGQPMGHSMRTCVIGMNIGAKIGLPPAALGSLYYALLMKDAGCSVNASRMFQILRTGEIKAKGDVRITDWSRLGWESVQDALAHVRGTAPFLQKVQDLFEVAVNRKRNAREIVRVRCERGAEIARKIGLSEATAEAIHSLDELWNGAGHPLGLRGEEIPVLARIMSLAQTVDVFYATHGAEQAVTIAKERSGRWFDPDLVRALCAIAKDGSFWADVDAAPTKVLELEPHRDTLPADEATVDNICLAFADVIDAKSPFTYRHSTGVASAAVAVAKALSMSDREVTLIRRAALLHDIGKLSVSNSILDKPDKLTAGEFNEVRKHPEYSYEILKRIPNFADLSEIAASHHEKLDGTGYFRGITGENMSLPARILVVSDIFDALAAARPYRDALPLEKVFSIMEKDAPHALDADCLQALKYSCGSGEKTLTEMPQAKAGAELRQAMIA